MDADWEDLITLNSRIEPDFEVLEPAAAHYAATRRKDRWEDLDFREAMARDTLPLPVTADREGYNGADHFGYWAGGLRNARWLIETAREQGVELRQTLDFGCASGRVIRHLAFELPDAKILGCDINRLHVEWCNRYLPANCRVFQNHSIPCLPLPDGSVDLVSAFSVFTHIEALETAWLMELRRVLRPGGLAWITVHSDVTLRDMTPKWPLWKPVTSHPDYRRLVTGDREFESDRLVLRWHRHRSYSSNVFYRLAYIERNWSRLMEIVHISPRHLGDFQDVVLLRRAD